jgi:hypothetical protein
MIIDGRNSDIEKGRKVSEIKSMEVEIWVQYLGF